MTCDSTEVATWASGCTSVQSTRPTHTCFFSRFESTYGFGAGCTRGTREPAACGRRGARRGDLALVRGRAGRLGVDLDLT